MRNKMKFPKKVQISTMDFKVIYNKNIGGGSVDFDLGIIEIGTMDLETHPLEVWDTICHEVSEACHVTMCTTYSDRSVTGNFKFFMDHKEFANHNKLFSVAITQFIK